MALIDHRDAAEAGLRVLTDVAHPDARVTPVTPDVTGAALIQAAADQVESLDILVNNAGIPLLKT